MNPPGEADLLVRIRVALLDALEALAEHRASVVVIGAQAVYLRTGSASVALPETTKDSDLAIDPRELASDPHIEAAMAAAGFVLDPAKNQPGAWIKPDTGIPVDLMVPESLAGRGTATTRGARIPPHSKRAMRRAQGLEGTIVDATWETIRALDATDPRSFEVRVAGPSSLLVAKVFKIAERIATPHRLNDKDAHDIYRILQAVETDDLAHGVRRLLADPTSSQTTGQALQYMNELFGTGSGSGIPLMAGRAEQGIGEPEIVAVSTLALYQDLIDALQQDLDPDA